MCADVNRGVSGGSRVTRPRSEDTNYKGVRLKVIKKLRGGVDTNM